MYLDVLTYVGYGPKENGSWDGTPEVDLKAQANAALAAAAAAALSASDAAAKAVLTAADRVQTNLDRIAAAASSATASTKAAQASDDADATAADRVQTGADKVAAAASATNAATSASGASGSATAAATSASNAATSATTATTKAGEASTSATTASGAATTATTKAGEAATSAADALAAKNAAEAAAGSMTTVPAQIVAAAAKTTPVDADLVGLVDSAASNALKKLTWANVKATLKTYFDTLYQATSTKLTTLAGQTWAADRFTYYTSASAAAIGTITAFGRSLIDDADASAARTTLGLGSAATTASTAYATAAQGTKADAAQPALTRSVITTAQTLASGIIYFVNTAGGAFTVTLPASPTDGMRLLIVPDSSVETNALTINTNGATLDGSTADVVVRQPIGLEFVYQSSAWRVI
ncbi:MAG TPA: hypothetical protein VIL30_04470 [Ramlibacter sp.]|jgi:hypothetical protein